MAGPRRSAQAAGHTGAVVREDAETLRRRLYAPGASPADLDRYRSTGAGVPRSAARTPPRRRGRVVVVLIVAALTATVGGVATARLAADAGPPVPAPTPVAMTAVERQEIAEQLARGDAAGIAAYLITHPSPPGLRTATRFDTVERHGVGDTVVTLSPVLTEAVQGRATVLVALARTGRAGWTAQRRTVDAAGRQRTVRQAERAGTQEAGALTTHTFRYPSGERPIELHVQVPEGTRWGIAVVFSD